MIVTAKVLARQQRQKSMNSSLKIRHQDKAAHIGIPHIFNLSAIGGWKKRHRPINRMKSIIITVEKNKESEFCCELGPALTLISVVSKHAIENDI